MATVIFVLCILLAITVASWIFKRYQRLRFFKIHGIPGPKPNFFVGNMYQLRATKTPKDTIGKWLDEYGNVFGYFLGDKPHMVVNDLDIIKSVMIKEFHKFADRPEMHMKNVKPLVDSVMCQRGQRWKEVRSILTPSFSSTKMKQMVDVMNRYTDVLVNVFAKYAETGEPCEVYGKVQALTVDVVGKCALAMDINSQKNNNDPFLQAVRDFFDFAHNGAVELAIIFPFLSPILVFINNYLTAGKMTNMVVQNLKHVINARQKNQDVRGIDLLQLLLDSSDTRSSNEGSLKRKVSLTYDEIIANCHISLLAGYETTATALAYSLYLLATHPEVQEKLFEEVSPNLESNSQSPYEIIQGWQYLDQVFQESLRIYPPVTGFLTRHCQEECIINGLHFPKGVNVEIPVWQIHHNPDLWPDPYKFDPERFSPENKSKIHPAAFLPFGIGPRSCLGMRFAQVEAKLALAKLVWKFKLVPSEKTEIPPSLACLTVITIPVNGVYVKVVNRD